MPYKDPSLHRAAIAVVSRRHYERNRDTIAEAARADKRRKRDWLEQQKDRPCEDCGRSYPSYVMDFDHLPERGEKSFNISRIGTTRGWETLRAEVAKCEVVCANCHRIRTHERKTAGED